MYWVLLGLLSSALAAQSSYDLETRAVSFPSKPSLGPLYSPGLSAAQGFRDNSYEDNAVTPTPSPTPIYRNSNQQPVSFEITYIYLGALCFIPIKLFIKLSSYLFIKLFIFIIFTQAALHSHEKRSAKKLVFLEQAIVKFILKMFLFFYKICNISRVLCNTKQQN